MAGGKVVQMIGQRQEARAAEGAARAAEAEARAQREITTAEARRVEGNATSVQELQALDKQLEVSQRQVERDQKMIDAIDPSLMEASQQLLKVLRGEQTGVGAALDNQRQRQRQQLLNQLRAQLGPGAETSTAGMQALSKFDSESGMLSANTQQQSIGTLLGVYGQGTATDYSKGLNALGMTAQGFGNRSSRMLQGGQGVLQAMIGGNQNVLNTVGSEFVGDQMMGRGTQQIGREWSQDSAKFMSSAMSMGAAMSDARVKTDVTKLPESLFRDVPTYHFRYVDEVYGTGWHFGTMAQDLLRLNPNHPAVTVGKDGFYRVNYDLLERN